MGISLMLRVITCSVLGFKSCWLRLKPVFGTFCKIMWAFPLSHTLTRLLHRSPTRHYTAGIAIFSNLTSFWAHKNVP